MKHKFLFILLAGLLMHALGLCVPSQAATINLDYPEKSTPLVISIDAQRSHAHNWKPGHIVRIRAFIENADGSKIFLHDKYGKKTWLLMLNEHGEAELKIQLDKNSYSGAFKVTADGKAVDRIGEALNPNGLYWVDKVREYHFPDGAAAQVHFTDQVIDLYGGQDTLAAEIMDAAVSAYQTITQFEGFNSARYSFAQADPNYAIDPDKTIDIYVGTPTGFNGYPALGLRNHLFKDAPCFDTIPLKEDQYDAVILLPANYRDFIRGWEKINPSPLGRRNIAVDLRGTLIHEMLHVVVFYYNKNLNKSLDPGLDKEDSKLDWYVEGLARYFETFAGARHDFYSQGFKQTLPDKIRFSRGGSNYFMRYPDQAFFQLRYENALFWRYLDHRYGMEAIEELSRDLRSKDLSFKQALEHLTKIPFEKLLQDYAKALLLKDFGLKEDSVYLNSIARTRLKVHQDEWILRGSAGEEKLLGKVCATDWIGQWEEFGALMEQPSVAGDSTYGADVSGWATDYFELTKDQTTLSWPPVAIQHRGSEGTLMVQILGITKGGSQIEKELMPILSQNERTLDLSRWIASEGLSDDDLQTVYFLITNSDPETTIPYALNLSD